MKKTNTCLLRLSAYENSILDFKSKFLGITKSKLLREGLFSYWTGKPDANRLLKIYQEGNNQIKKLVVDMIMEYYRHKGYPHNHLSFNQLQKEMRKISNTKSPLLENNHLQSNTVGLALANHFHPHMVKVKCLSNYRTAYDQFSDDDLLRDAINRWMELNKKVDTTGLRRILRTRNGVRSVVNFKPAIAKYFYDNYCPINGKVLDPCAGYGGRLAGCISTNKNIQYHGIDPQGETASGNMKMAAFYVREIGLEREWNFRFRFDLGCAEDVMPHLESDFYDLIFTSPPFFNVEKYDTDHSQSYIRYPTYEKWREMFIKKVISEASRIVKSNGYVILNAKNYKKMSIMDDICEYCRKFGLLLIKTYHMRLANSEYHRQDNKPMFHTEPIVVFKKRLYCLDRKIQKRLVEKS